MEDSSTSPPAESTEAPSVFSAADATPTAPTLSAATNVTPATTGADTNHASGDSGIAATSSSSLPSASPSSAASNTANMDSSESTQSAPPDSTQSASPNSDFAALPPSLITNTTTPPTSAITVTAIADKITLSPTSSSTTLMLPSVYSSAEDSQGEQNRSCSIFLSDMSFDLPNISIAGTERKGVIRNQASDSQTTPSTDTLAGSVKDVIAFRIKRVGYKERKVPILLQNENGPCPLLAVANALLLRGEIAVHDDYSSIFSSDLLQIIAERLLERNPPLKDPELSSVQQKNLEDAMGLLPSLIEGMDVNIKFNSISGFEFTPALSIFDLLRINLYHGWLLDAQDTETSDVIHTQSYNQLIEKVVEYRTLLATENLTESGSDHANHEITNSEQKEIDACANERAEAKKDTAEVVEEDDAKHEVIGEERAREECKGSDTNTDEKHRDKFERKKDEENEDGKQARNDTKERDIQEKHTEATDDANSESLSAILRPLSVEQHIQTTQNTRTSTSLDDNAESLDRTRHLYGKSLSKERISLLKAERQYSDRTAAKEMKRIMKEGPVISRFLEDSASQLTYFGLSELYEGVKEGEICVFFRNNHFSTMTKHDGELFLLVTDAGYEYKMNVVWEKLGEIDGDLVYCQANFRAIPQMTEQELLEESVGSGAPQAAALGENDPDYQLALSLQQEEAQNVAARPPPSSVAAPDPFSQLSEEELRAQMRAEQFYQQKKWERDLDYQQRLAQERQRQSQGRVAPPASSLASSSSSSAYAAASAAAETTGGHSTAGTGARSKDKKKKKKKDNCIIA